jgi:hypothetical protein
MRRALRLAATSILVAAPLAAQANGVAARVAAVREGMVSMRFAARPNVCGDGNGSVWTQGDGNRWYSDRNHVCINGPVVVRIGRSEGQTISVRKSVGVRANGAGADVDLGDVSADDAARYLISLTHSIGGGSADEALSAAGFAAASDLSTEFRAVLRDENAPIGSRKSAMFWLGQTDTPTATLVNLDSELQTRTLREQYTFVLSQRHDEASARKLMDIARTDRDTEVRKKAMFWLGQSKDPAVTKFFKDILTP